MSRGAPPPPPERVKTAEVARRAGVTPATLRRWVADGLVPGRRARPAPTGRRSRSPTRGSSRACASAATRSQEIRRATKEGRLAFGYVEELMPTRRRDVHAAPGRRAQTGLEPALVERIFGMLGFAQPEHLGAEDVEMLEQMAEVLDAGLPARRVPAADARLRAGARADRRRRGAPVPPLRPRAADARRRPGPAGRRADGGADRAAAAVLLAGDGPRPPAPAAPLRRAGHRRAHGGRPRQRRERRARPDAHGDRVRRPRRLHAAHRAAGRRGGGEHRRALRRRRDAHAARRGADREDDRRRGDARLQRPGRAHGLGGRLPGARRRAARCRGSASTPARCSTATATTTAAR